MYLKPVAGGSAERASGPAGSLTGVLAADGGVVAFLSDDLGSGDPNGFRDVDLQLGIRQGDFDLSADGRFVAFVSGAALLPGAELGSLATYRVENPLWAP